MYCIRGQSERCILCRTNPNDVYYVEPIAVLLYYNWSNSRRNFIGGFEVWEFSIGCAFSLHCVFRCGSMTEKIKKISKTTQLNKLRIAVEAAQVEKRKLKQKLWNDIDLINILRGQYSSDQKSRNRELNKICELSEGILIIEEKIEQIKKDLEEQIPRLNELEEECRVPELFEQELGYKMPL